MVWVVLLCLWSVWDRLLLWLTAARYFTGRGYQNSKNTFEVPQEFQEFSSGFANYDKRQIWHLNWNALQEPGSQGQL